MGTQKKTRKKGSQNRATITSTENPTQNMEKDQNKETKTVEEMVLNIGRKGFSRNKLGRLQIRKN